MTDAATLAMRAADYAHRAIGAAEDAARAAATNRPQDARWHTHLADTYAQRSAQYARAAKTQARRQLATW